MKKIIFTLVLCIPFVVQAQDFKDILPVYFPDKPRSEVDKFSEAVMSKMPEYHLVSFDSSDDLKWRFTFRNNTDQKDLDIYFDFDNYGSNSALGQSGTYIVKRVRITAPFLSIAKLFRIIFGSNITPAELNKIGKISEVVHLKDGREFMFALNDGGGLEWNIDFEQRW